MYKLSPTHRKLLRQAFDEGAIYPRPALAASIKSLERGGLIEHSETGRGFRITQAGVKAMRAKAEPQERSRRAR